MVASSSPAAFTSALFPSSTSAWLSHSASHFLSSDWPHASLFSSLSRQLRLDEYEWDVLVAIKQTILAEGRVDDSASGSGDSSAADGRAVQSHTADEEEEEDEDTAESGTELSNAAGTASSGSVDELLQPVSRVEAIDPLSALPAAQSRCFQCLAAVIREQLSYLPTSPPMPVMTVQSASEDGSSGVNEVSSNTAAPTHPPVAHPIARARDGDVMGLFLLSLLLSSPSLPFAQSTLALLELLGSLTNLRLTIRSLIDVTQKPLHVQLPPNLAHTALEHIDLTPHSKQTFVTQHLTPSALLPLLVTTSANGSDTVSRFHLRSLIFRLLSAILTQSLASYSPLTALSPEPAVWYQFTDTPLFPKVTKVLPPVSSSSSSSAASAAVPSIHTHGYTWHTWLSLTGRRDAPNNVFRFFNDTGFGLQVHVKGDSLAVRTLPNTADAIILKGGELREGEWVHVAISHKPLPRPTPPPQATPINTKRAYPPAVNPNTAGLFVSTNTVSPSISQLSLSPSPSSTPASPHNARPGRLTLHLNGQPVSVTDVPYPNLEQTDNLQCTLGGLYGRMAAFYLLADVLPSDLIASLYAIGAQHFAVPAMHVLHAGLIAVFPPPPSATSSTAVASSHLPSSTSAAVVPNTSRTVARCLMAQSPAQTTHSVCLPVTWTDDNQTASQSTLTPLTQPTTTSSSAINQCLHHTLRLDGTTVVYRTQNAQTLSALGGLKLFILRTSPTYCAAPFESDEEVCELLLLLAGLILSSESHAHLLLEIGAVTVKQLYLDHCKRRHRTVRLLAAIRRLLLAISLVDLTADRAHFASFTSAFLLD